MAIEGALTRQRCAEKWCTTLWDPGLKLSVSLDNQTDIFRDFLKYWNFNVLEMALRTLRVAQGLPRTPLYVS